MKLIKLITVLLIAVGCSKQNSYKGIVIRKEVLLMHESNPSHRISEPFDTLIPVKYFLYIKRADGTAIRCTVSHYEFDNFKEGDSAIVDKTLNNE